MLSSSCKKTLICQLILTILLRFVLLLKNISLTVKRHGRPVELITARAEIDAATVKIGIPNVVIVI